MKEFRDYDILFPELVYDIVDYFRPVGRGKPIKSRSVLDFCLNSRFNASFQKGDFIQPDVVHNICETFVRKHAMTCVRTGMGSDGKDANYLYYPSNDEYFNKKEPALIFRLNCMAYGFRYIYASYRDYVLPVEVKKEDKVTLGTCFRFLNGIVTAKHCLDVDQVRIIGLEAERLKKSPVYVSKDNSIDMAFIDLGEFVSLFPGKAEVLDEVLVMGYPKIPMFFDFCTAERASVSSIVPTKGAVASLADQYISRNAGPLMLVTARIRGGNSGGPVIDSCGAVVGVSFAEPTSEGDYDEMGYGVAYPIEVLRQLLKDSTTMDVNFVERIE